jgi:hypothetical protein
MTNECDRLNNLRKSNKNTYNHLKEKKMRKIAHVMPFFVCFFVLFIATASASESIPVSCYIDDLSDNLEIGEIEIFDVANATNACNETFNDCDGECIGCYINADSIEMCIDANGNQFKKE